jgi:transcriptional regulator with XRE-family HTH domain
MAVGERIKRIRNLRRMTQKELGLALGFDENTADVRVAQYETGTRTPKEEAIRKIADVLDVNYRSIYEPTLYATEDVMYTLFELDKHYSIRLHEVTDDTDLDYTEKHISVDFQTRLLNEFLAEWLERKKDLADGSISKAEYMEWKFNWPQSAGKNPSKQWRKPPETIG